MNLRVFNNAKWIILCRIIQSGLALLISMISARYLGPSNFGTINYAASLVAFVTPIMYLGLNNVIVQELVENPEDEGAILGTSITMSFTSAIVCIFMITIFAYCMNTSDTTTVIVVLLYGLLLISQSVDLIQYWFQAKLLSKYTSITMLCAYIIVSIYKIYLFITQKSIYWFAISNAFDYIIIAITLVFIYKKLGGKKLFFSLKTAKKLFSKSRYYIVSAMMVTIFAQTDKIMIKTMINETAVGFYSAGVSCAGLTSFLFVAIIDSMRPLILENNITDKAESEHALIQLYSIVIWLALLQSVCFSLFSRWIILFLYGKQYLQTITVLKIIVWYTTFSYIGAVRNVWILANNKHQYLWIINLSGALCNIILNLILIPFAGINGAAIASLITQIFTNVIIGFIIKPISENNRFIIKALDPKEIIIISKKNIYNKRRKL